MLKDDALRREEHEAIRNKVGYYDFTHQLLEVTGKDAEEFLNWIYVGKINTTPIDKARYTTMLNEQGEIIDDVIIFRLDEKRFRISTLFINELIAWFDAHKGNYEVRYENITEENAMYAVQGPNSRELLNRVFDRPIDKKCKFFNMGRRSIQGIPVSVVRGGFTGELGFELYVYPRYKDMIEEELEKAGADLGIKKITTDVIIGSIPAEKGYVLMSDIAGTNPYEVGFGWTVAMDTDFIGKQATEKVLDEGGKHQLLGFEINPDFEVEPEEEIRFNGTPVGKVTKFAYGYTVEKAIGYALVNNSVAIGDEVTIGNREIPATLVEREWYDIEDTRPRS